MGWNIFSNKRAGRIDKLQEDVDRLITQIERFAPKRFKGEREAFFYNYRITAAYLMPLIDLLRVIAMRKDATASDAGFTRELFLKLKDFYDVRRRLSIKEAMENRGLKIKLEQVFALFYNRERIAAGDIKQSLEGLDTVLDKTVH
jgi:hypothetical protein